MKFLSISFIATLLTPSIVFALPLDLELESKTPSYPRQAACTNPVLRKEWNVATATEKASYINAVLCLSSKPSKLGLNTTLADDFTWVHAQLDPEIHLVAQFVPWHRYFMHIYEKELNACGYNGAQLYWDFPAVWSAPHLSPVWSPTTGFGGNGTDAEGIDRLKRCVTDGPFATLRPSYFGNAYLPHCLTRSFFPVWPSVPDYSIPMMGYRFRPAVIERTMTAANYTEFYPRLFNGAHGAIHDGMRGDIRPTSSAANDPMFFLIHTYVDKQWSDWQKLNYSARAYDYAGLELGGVPATLETKLRFLGLASDLTVRDVMVTDKGPLCYRY